LRRIVADSGPLIAFGRGGRLDLLSRVAGELLVPSAVFREGTRDGAKPGAAALLAAGKAGLLRIEDTPDPETIAYLGNPPALDEGEIAALALALDRQCPLLMEERLGRNLAKRHGIAVVGSAGILLVAKERGLVGAVAPILAEWQGWGYFLSSQLLEAVLRRAGEWGDRA
jgi:predicted nucleic acid-binding protein